MNYDANIPTNTKRRYRSFDYLLAAAVVGLCIFGLIIIPSAGAGLGIDPKEFRMQRVWVATGIIIMVAAAFIDYRFICKFYIPLYLGCLGLLVLIILLKRMTGKDMLREIGYPFGSPRPIISIMPSEFTKIFIIIAIASFLDRFKDKRNKILIVGAVVAGTIIPFIMIAMQPSLSASLAIMFIMVVMLYAGGISYRYFIIAAAVVVPLGAFLYYDVQQTPHILIDKIPFIQAYQIEDRLLPFIDPTYDEDSLFQTNQSIEAISSGGLAGNGLKNNEVLVPKQANDFVFAVIGSEFGFLGAVAVIAAGFLIVFKCLITSVRSEVYLGRLIAAGAAAMFGFHIFLNVGVATGIMPNTGITFPFISTGGSSIWVCMACIGLVMNVGMTKGKTMFE